MPTFLGGAIAICLPLETLECEGSVEQKTVQMYTRTHIPGFDISMACFLVGTGTATPAPSLPSRAEAERS